MNQLTNALRGGVTQKQAQGNQAGNTSAQNVASKATQSGGGNGTITAEEQKAIENIKKLHDETEQAWQEFVNAAFDITNSSQDLQTKAEQKWKDAREKEDKTRDEATAKGVPFVSEAWLRTEKDLSTRNTVRIPVSRHLKQPTEEEIIDRISGGDETPGSCSSVAFAYVANKCGLDVLDYRGDGDDGIDFFSGKFIKKEMLQFPGIKGRDLKVRNPSWDGAEVLMNLEKDKEYYLSFEGHSAIIKNTDQGVKYLELQEPKGNGWRLMGRKRGAIANELIDRFGATKYPHKVYGNIVEVSMRLLEVDSFKGSREFERLAEYFNTNESEQQKGAKGRAK